MRMKFAVSALKLAAVPLIATGRADKIWSSIAKHEDGKRAFHHSNLPRESGCYTLEATGVCFATVKSLQISESAVPLDNRCLSSLELALGRHKC
jgi:hypothetical protein